MIKKGDKKSKNRRQSQKLDYGDICPRCNQPNYSQPYMPYYYQPALKKKSSSFGIIIVVIVILSFIGFGACVYLTNFFNPFGPREETSEFSSEVIIANGGHFKYILENGYYENVKVKFDITLIDGSAFDVYIMEEDQIENAYDNQNVSLISFSAVYSKENITQLDDTIKLPYNGGHNSIYLVIDNRDTPLTLNDAKPTRDITVNVDLEIITTYEWD